MLTSVLEINKAFDETLKKSLPYLIFPHRDYREKLVDLLSGFCQYHRENNQLAFTERYNSIQAFFKECEAEGFDTFTELNIHYLTTHQTSLHQIHLNTEHRLRSLEKDVAALMKHNSSSKKKEVEALPELSPEAFDCKPTDLTQMTPVQKTEALMYLLKSSYKPLSLMDINKTMHLTESEFHNRLASKKFRDNIESIKRSSKTIQKRNGKMVPVTTYHRYYIWKDNIPADGVIPEPETEGSNHESTG